MKTIWTAITLFAMVLMVPLGSTVAQQTPDMSAEEAAAHEALRALKQGAETAFNKLGETGDEKYLETLLEFVHDDVVLSAMNGVQAVGKQGLIDYYKKSMTGPDRTVQTVYHTFEVAALTKLHGDDTGVAYGTSVGTYELTDGLSFTANTKWTATMVKEDGKWLLASFQFAPSIFENPLLEKATEALYLGVIAAGLIGMLLGYLLCRLFGKRRQSA